MIYLLLFFWKRRIRFDNRAILQEIRKIARNAPNFRRILCCVAGAAEALEKLHRDLDRDEMIYDASREHARAFPPVFRRRHVVACATHGVPQPRVAAPCDAIRLRARTRKRRCLIIGDTFHADTHWLTACP